MGGIPVFFEPSTRLLGALLAVLSTPAIGAAHPVPFSYVDVRLDDARLDVAVVAHVYDVAHDLGHDVAASERLLDVAVLRAEGDAIARLVTERLAIEADGERLPAPRWSLPEPIPDRASIRLVGTAALRRRPGAIVVRARLFPYDPQHQTFVNVYERGQLRLQAMLGGARADAEYFAGTAQGALAVVRRFVPLGVHHILVGPDHVLFLFGLLLLGGTLRRVAVLVSGFTVAHSVTLSLAALGIVAPPASLVEPAIALSIVYVGVDNLLVGGGRDARTWIAFGFGFVHGFGFASVLREMELPARALGWSLFSFNAGVEVGQLLIVVPIAAGLAALRARHAPAGRWVAVAGSWLVIAAGAFWFVERVVNGGSTA